MLSLKGAEFETRLRTVTTSRRTVLDAVLDVHATVFSRLLITRLLSLSLSF